jgi:tetratricopeptide (TPR) repeat protein
MALLKLGKVPEAKAELIRTVEVNPFYVEAYSNLGNILVVENRFDDAIEIYKKALTIRPNDAQVWYNLSVALDSKGDREEAIKACRNALSIKPDFPSAQQFCGFRESGIPLK